MTAAATPASMHAVIVNYRTAELTVECLASLEPEIRERPRCRAIIVDNASADGSADIIANAITARGWSSWAELIRSPVNGGFAAGNNVALEAIARDADQPDLVWLLNPDTRVEPGAVAAILAFFAATPSAGIAGSSLVEANGTPWPYAFRFPTIWSEVERGARLGLVSRLLAKRAVLRQMGPSPARVEWVSGASMVIRRAVFDAIGMMDEGYFLYFEETDFCLRAARAGWESWYVPTASVLHIAGQSTGLNDARPATGRIPRYWFESRRRYFVKNHGRAYAILADVAWAASHLLWRVRRRWAANVQPDPPFLLSDFLRRSAILVGGRNF